MSIKTFQIAIFLIAFNLIVSPLLFSQDKPNTITYGHDTPLLGPDKTTNMPTHNESPEINALLEQQKQAKLSGNVDAQLNLQRQIDALSGDGYTTSNLISAGTGNKINQGDNIVNTRIFTNPAGTYVKAFATATEQRGANTGRIWAIWAYGNYVNTVPDTMLVYYSDNGGITWNGNSYWIPGGNSKINPDEMDMEIMEYTAGNKYVWVTIGLTSNTNQKYTDILIIQTPTFAAGFWTLNWPGGSANTNYYKPRITSDNSFYNASSSWNFIIASRDTLSAANTHKIGEKFVKCINPFTTSPTLTYKGTAYYYDIVYGGTGSWYQFADQCDIAYLRNGSDSLVVTESNLPDTTIIYAMKSSESPEVNGSTPFANLDGGTTSSKQKQYARIESNGNPRIMIAFRSNFNNSGDWDIKFAYNDGGRAASSWANGYIDGFASTTTYPYQPDLIGLRGTTSFKCSYVYFNSGIDSAMIASSPAGTWLAPTRVSLTGTDVSVTASSHAGYRFVNGDSCITLWSQYPGTNLWAAAGCSGTIVTGISNNGNTTPVVYALEQNYPNPFNPSTVISFSLPKAGDVKLTIYDLTGRVVTELVNGNLEAGIHKINFNAENIASGVYFYAIKAGDFTATKKMLLVK